MKQTINFPDFCNQFKNLRPDNFSYSGLRALFDYLEEVDPDMELDVIAICCDYSEYELEELKEQFDQVAETETIEECARILSDHTQVIPVDGNTLIIQDF